MCTAANVYINTIYKPALCPFPFCTRNFGHIQQMARLYNMIIPLMTVFITFQCKTLDHKTMGFSQGHFKWFFLNGILQCFLQVINIWQPRDKMSHQLQVSISLPFCLCSWILFLKAKWPMNIFTTWHESVTRWRFWARGGRHFLVTTPEGGTPPHQIDDLCNDKKWILFSAN